MQQTALNTEKAIIIHTVKNTPLDVVRDYQGGEFYHRQTDISLALTVHDIKQSSNGAVMGAGRVLSESDKQQLKDYLNGENEIRNCWLPRNLMMLNSSQMVWYVPSRKRPMHFRSNGKVMHIDVIWPSLVFRFSASGTLSVAAYAGKGAPKPSTKLYHAPLWNIYANTRLCAGSAETTNIIGVEAMPIWEAAIFDTLFSHSNHSLVIKPKGSQKAVSDASYLRFMRQKAKRNEIIKASEMTPLNKTLEQWAGGQN